MGRAIFQGIDYGSIPPVLDLLEITDHDVRREVFAGLQIMEAAAVTVLNETRDDE